MKSLKAVNKITSMSSVDVAELTSKRHDNVLRDIDSLLKTLSSELGSGYSLVSYKDSTGKSNRMYKMDEASFNLLIDKYSGLNKVPHRLQEEAALKTIEQLLNISLIRQYKVLNYRIDGYDAKNNIAYEIDEPEHRSKINQDSIRQKEIERVLKCKFVRIKL